MVGKYGGYTSIWLVCERVRGKLPGSPSRATKAQTSNTARFSVPSVTASLPLDIALVRPQLICVVTVNDLGAAAPGRPLNVAANRAMSTRANVSCDVVKYHI
jgi:hypothetical protein